MSIEHDVARDGKKTLSLVAILALALGGITYLFLGWWHRPAASESDYNLGRVANHAPVSSQESHEYRTLLRLSNQQGAQEAETEGSSFVASLSESQLQAAPAVSAAPVVTPVGLATTDNTVPASGGTTPGGGLNDEQKTQVDNLLKQLNARWQPVDMQLAASFSRGDGGQDGAVQGAFTAWAQSVPGLRPAPPAPAPAPAVSVSPAPARIHIAGLSRYPATLESAIDSDNPGSVVLARIPAGRLAGAVLAAKGVQLAGDGVVVNFKTLTHAGMTCTVDAYALDDETQRSSVASQVNHRYFTRIVLPALANGLGKVGQLYQDSNTQILSTTGGTITGRSGPPDGKAVAGVIAGGIGQQTAQVMTQDASRLPATQVNVDRRQVVSVLFMTPVTEKDCTPTSTGEP